MISISWVFISFIYVCFLFKMCILKLLLFSAFINKNKTLILNVSSQLHVKVLFILFYYL